MTRPLIRLSKTIRSLSAAVLVTAIFLLDVQHAEAQPSTTSINKAMSEINRLRSRGCRCGDDYMPPVHPLRWSKQLYEVSKNYAYFLRRYNIFSHVTPSGRTLGDRLDDIGYDWQYIGENLGKGYGEFYAVFEAWKKSPSHCKMLMDANVTEIGMSRVSEYWVQSFSKPAE